jgi:glycosyltransferase involved in cell wall biosynthesis
MTGIGAVVIGRNEGVRLDTCLRSVRAQFQHIVYVDSGSIDGSVARATLHGVPVVQLDPALPFTAARARNAGFACLRRSLPDLAFVQFVDGDCELVAGWCDDARGFLAATPGAAVVCGRRRERHPDASRYNRLCDYEWDTPIGVADTCGGDALYRAAAFAAAGGFSEDLIAGEEPDLCHRIRMGGGTIHRIDRDMTIHDAAMTDFLQWWQRNRRSGYASAEALARRGRGNPRMLRQVASNLFWAIPLIWPLWPLLWWRILRRRGSLYATFATLGKIPHCHGQLDYWSRRRSLIEYK